MIVLNNRFSKIEIEWINLLKKWYIMMINNNILNVNVKFLRLLKFLFFIFLVMLLIVVGISVILIIVIIDFVIIGGNSFISFLNNFVKIIMNNLVVIIVL